MLQSQPIYSTSPQLTTTFPQTQSLTQPNQSPTQPELRQVEISSLNNNPNAPPHINSGVQKPIITSQAYNNTQYQSNGQQILTSINVNQSSLRQTRESKYKNKYSFKKNTTLNSVGPVSSINRVEAAQSLRISQQLITQTNQYKALISQQEFALARIRDIALNRRNAFDVNKLPNPQCVRDINALTEIYNLTLVNIGNVKPLEFVEYTQVNSQSYRPVIREEVVSLPPPVQVVSLPPNLRPQFTQQTVNFSQTQPQTFTIPPPQVVTVPQVNTQQIKIESRPVYQPTYQTFQIPQPVTTTVNTLPTQKTEVTYSSIPATVPKPEITYETYQTTTYKESKPVETYKYEPFSFTKDFSSTNNHYQELREQKKTIITETYTYNGGNTLNQNGQTFVFESAEVRELRQRVELLEQEKATLIDKIRVYEKGNNFQNLNNKETIENCQQEIAQLKAQIAELTLIYNNTSGRSGEAEAVELKKAIAILEDTIKQYEEQLIQAQNHIIFLQNSQGGEANLHVEIKYLRETIAKYTEHIEQLNIQRSQYEQHFHQKEQEIQSLAHDLNEANHYIQTLQQHIQTIPQQGGISYEAYQAVFVDAGKRQLQVTILLQEINRLNHVNGELKQHLERAEQYIIGLQQGKTNSRNEDQLVALQNEYNRTLAIIGEYEQKITEISQENQSLKSKSTLHTVKVGSTPVHNEQSQYHLEEIKRKEEETHLLKQELSLLSERYADARDHLQKAEEYIIQLQQNYEQSPVNALASRPDTERQLLEEQLQEWQSKVTLLEKALGEERVQRESLQKRSATFTAEYEDMEYRYKTALDQLSKRYDQLLDERNNLATKVSSANSNIQPPIISEQEVQTLRKSLDQLNSQLIESKQHLETAQAYIQKNAKNWQEASSFKERHDQLQSFVVTINSDLESTRRQNEELAARLRSLEALVGEVERLKAQNENLTIVIREKDNAGVSTSLKQIDQVQGALANYTRLYQESEAKVKQLELTNQHLQLQVTQLEEYLSKAESFIIEQEANDKTSDKKVKELTEQLVRAEEHIFALEREYDTLLKQKGEYEVNSKAEVEKNAQLIQALNKAESYIYEIQAKSFKK